MATLSGWQCTARPCAWCYTLLCEVTLRACSIRRGNSGCWTVSCSHTVWKGQTLLLLFLFPGNINFFLIHQAEARHQEVLVARLELVLGDEQLSSRGKQNFHFLREIGQGPHEQAPGPGKYLKSEKTAGAVGVLEFKTDLDTEACGHERFV